MQREYWRRIRERATKDARSALAIETRERIVIGAVVTIAAIGLLWLFGSEGASWDEAIAKVGPWVFLIVAVYPVVWIYHFIHSPAHMDSERRLETAAEMAAFNDEKNRLIAHIAELEAGRPAFALRAERVEASIAWQTRNYHLSVPVLTDQQGNDCCLAFIISNSGNASAFKLSIDWHFRCEDMDGFISSRNLFGDEFVGFADGRLSLGRLVTGEGMYYGTIYTLNWSVATSASDGGHYTLHSSSAQNERECVISMPDSIVHAITIYCVGTASRVFEKPPGQSGGELIEPEAVALPALSPGSWIAHRQRAGRGGSHYEHYKHWLPPLDITCSYQPEYGDARMRDTFTIRMYFMFDFPFSAYLKSDYSKNALQLAKDTRIRLRLSHYENMGASFNL